MTPRQLIFRIVAALSAGLLLFNQKGAAWIAASFLTVNGWFRGIFAALSLWIMRGLDSEAMDRYEQEMEMIEALQSGPSEATVQNTELKLLDAGYKIRNHAQETGDWTDTHTEALQAIGDALLNECSWPEPKVHAKLKEIVESIEGLSYGDE